MNTILPKMILRLLIALAAMIICLQSALAQSSCLSHDDVQRMLSQINSQQPVSFNKKLADELLKLTDKDQQRLQDSVGTEKSDELLKRLKANREKNTARLCPILQKFGWPTAAVVGPEGVEAAFLLLKNSSSLDLQRDLLPVIIAEIKKGEIAKPGFPGYFDRLRLGAGLKQLFGTQATVADGFLVLFPIEGETHVDERRGQYGLPPLSDYLRALEQVYGIPLIRSRGALTNSYASSARGSIANTGADGLFEDETLNENEVIRVETNLVSLNVSVYSQKLKTQVNTLEQTDFTVSEDGQAQTITYFATTDVPFDLVLLLDLSGSTANKRDLIRQATQRFIKAARPFDRLAIVSFSDETNVLCPLTEDRTKLLESVNKIDGGGWSNVWDALKFTLDHVTGPRTIERRRAVVFMTDGVDNALQGFGGKGSKISFADLLEAVRTNDTLIIPIYLDVVNEARAYGWDRGPYENAHKTLLLLADESGGLFYAARKIEQLSGVYDQVIEDLGKVYSLGYKPTNPKRDGSWRTVKIEIRNRPELSTRAKSGYYAK